MGLLKFPCMWHVCHFLAGLLVLYQHFCICFSKKNPSLEYRLKYDTINLPQNILRLIDQIESSWALMENLLADLVQVSIVLLWKTY